MRFKEAIKSNQAISLHINPQTILNLSTVFFQPESQHKKSWADSSPSETSTQDEWIVY